METLSKASPTGTHPETGLYHQDHMPPADDEQLRITREKQMAGEPLSLAESLRAGRDTTLVELEGYELKPDHVYRAIGKEALDAYLDSGFVESPGDELDEYEQGNNKGIDWYLGAVALRYGGVVIETPADPEYFQPALHNGHALAKDPRVRHMKSSGRKNPIPFDRVNIIHGPGVSH